MSVRQVLFVALSVLPFAAGRADAADWSSLRTPHFLLLGDATAGEIRDVAVRFEQFREAVGSAFPMLADRTPGPPVVVYVFRNQNSYEPFLPQFDGKPVRVGGYYLAGSDVNYITLSADSRGPEFQAVYHEFTHFLIHRLMPDLPPWFDEGLAEYFSTFELVGAHVARFGAPIRNHVALLRAAPMGMSELFAIRHDSTAYNEGDRRTRFYAEAWALLHYAMIDRPDRFTQLVRFRTFMDAGDAVDPAFEKAFGFGPAVLDGELSKYLARPTMGYLNVPIGTLSTQVRGDVIPLPVPDAQAWLGDLLAHGGRLDDAIVWLEKALAAKPDLAFAHASLGALLVHQGKNDLAMPHLQRAAALDSPNEFVHYYYGAALIERIGPNAGPEADFDQAITALTRAVELRPGFTEAEKLLGYAYLLRGETGTAREVLLRALREAPADHRTALLLAQADLRLGRFAEARELLGPLVARATDSRRRTSLDGCSPSRPRSSGARGTRRVRRLTAARRPGRRCRTSGPGSRASGEPTDSSPGSSARAPTWWCGSTSRGRCCAHARNGSATWTSSAIAL